MKNYSLLNRKNQIPFWKSLLSIITFLTFCQNSLAQVVTIPAANTNLVSSNKPLGAFYGHQRTAMIYTANELGLNSGAVIKSLSFYYNSYQTPNSSTPAIVRISNTTATTFSASTFASEIVGATEVANSGTMIPTSLPATGAWVGFVFDAPFFYTGDNIKITIETNAGGTGDENDLAKQYRWSSGASESWIQDNFIPTGVGTVNNTRPNIQFGFGFAPANDACSGAFVANTLPYTHMQVMAENATNDDGFLGCVNAMNDGVWYRFTGTGANMKVDLTNVFYTFDPQLDIYSGVCGNLSCVASADLNANGGNETITIPSVLGTTYFVNVGHWQENVDAPEGNFTIKITDERPSKFDFNSEVNYGYENQSVNVTVSRNRGSNGVSSVSYTPNDGSALGNIDYGSALGTLTWADGDNSLKTITIQLLPDAIAEGLETFNLLLINPTNGATTDFNETVVTIIDTTSPPVNDACSGALNAVTLPYSNVQVRGEATSNNAGYLSCGLDGMNDGVWYSFTGNGSNITVAITDVQLGTYPQLDIYTGSCGVLSCFQSSDNLSIGGGDSETITFLSTLGTNYFVNVGDGFGNFDAPEGNFKIDITTTALANNQFEFSNLKVYPNPVNNILNVENAEKITKVSIINLLGQELLSKNFDDLKTQIDISGLQSGSYLVRISSENKEQIVKIIKN
jgi:hypothetical protein